MSSTWKTDLLASLKESSIVPDVLPEDLDLTVKVSIQYGSSEPLTNGEIVVAGDKTKEGPIVRAEGTDPDALYSLLMVDPDAPSRQDNMYGEWRHWVQRDLCFNTSKFNITERGQAVTTYFGPGPRVSTGLHRYTFILARQPHSGEFNPPTLGSEFVERRSWNAKKWIEENGCVIVGVAWFYGKNAEDP